METVKNSEETVAKGSPLIDGLLLDFVRGAMLFNEVVPLILNVKGVIVSGNLINGKSYFEKTGDYVAQAKAAYSIEGAESIKKYFYDMAKDSFDVPQEKLENMELNFIHLENTTIWSGSQSFVIGLWRGKLEEVDGFSIGTLSKKQV